MKIILFGSASRGQMSAHSDFDIMVVLENSVVCRRTTQNIYRSLVGIGFAADIIVIHEEDVEALKNEEGTIVKPALTDGKVLYAA